MLSKEQQTVSDLSVPLLDMAVTLTNEGKFRAASAALFSVTGLYRDARVKNEDPYYRYASWWLFRRWTTWLDRIRDQLAETVEREEFCEQSEY
jgi:hypothetical protein